MPLGPGRWVLHIWTHGGHLLSVFYHVGMLLASLLHNENYSGNECAHTGRYPSRGHVGHTGSTTHGGIPMRGSSQLTPLKTKHCYHSISNALSSSLLSPGLKRTRCISPLQNVHCRNISPFRQGMLSCPWMKWHDPHH